MTYFTFNWDELSEIYLFNAYLLFLIRCPGPPVSSTLMIMTSIFCVIFYVVEFIPTIFIIIHVDKVLHNWFKKKKKTFISFHDIVLHQLETKPLFHYTIDSKKKKQTFIHYKRSYILLKLQKLKQNILFLLFHFFCIIMLKNCMIIDAKTKYFSILKSTAKSWVVSSIFHQLHFSFQPLSSPSSLPFTDSLLSFLLKFFSSSFTTDSDPRIASHSSSHIKYLQFRWSFCNYINGEIRNNKGRECLECLATISEVNFSFKYSLWKGHV